MYYMLYTSLYVQDFIRENNMIVNNMGIHLQCILNFAPNRDEDGGTIVVPGFHNRCYDWAREHIRLRKPLPWVQFPYESECLYMIICHVYV